LTIRLESPARLALDHRRPGFGDFITAFVAATARAFGNAHRHRRIDTRAR
jgi:hypothetical protein